MTDLCRDKTTIVIAHRLNTIASADKVVVLEDGNVVQTGSCRELLEDASGAFARMVASAGEAHEWNMAAAVGGGSADCKTRESGSGDEKRMT